MIFGKCLTFFELIIFLQIGKLDDLEDGQSYVCSGFGEPFKRLDYEASAITPQSFRLSGPESVSDSASPSPARANNRLSRYLLVRYYNFHILMAS